MNNGEDFEGLTNALAALAEKSVTPPAWLAGTITETVVERASRMAATRRVRETVSSPKVLGGGVLVAAGVAGAFMWKRRRNRTRATTRTRFRSALA